MLTDTQTRVRTRWWATFLFSFIVFLLVFPPYLNAESLTQYEKQIVSFWFFGAKGPRYPKGLLSKQAVPMISRVLDSIQPGKPFSSRHQAEIQQGLHDLGYSSLPQLLSAVKTGIASHIIQRDLDEFSSEILWNLAYGNNKSPVAILLDPTSDNEYIGGAISTLYLSGRRLEVNLLIHEGDHAWTFSGPGGSVHPFFSSQKNFALILASELHANIAESGGNMDIAIERLERRYKRYFEKFASVFVLEIQKWTAFQKALAIMLIGRFFNDEDAYGYPDLQVNHAADREIILKLVSSLETKSDFYVIQKVLSEKPADLLSKFPQKSPLQQAYERATRSRRVRRTCEGTS